MKRFTDTEKWRDPWFRSLPAPAKLIFFYLLDHCNNAGFHELDEDLMVVLTGMRKDHVEGALKALQRSIKGPFEGWFWIRRFLRHQKNENLNPENPAHKQIINLVSEQITRFSGCPEFVDFIAQQEGLGSPIKGPLLGLNRPIGKGKGTGTVLKEGIPKGRFKPPTMEEWQAQAKEIGYPKGDAEQAFHSYAAKGWKVGTSPMESWKSAIQTCKSRWQNTGSINLQGPAAKAPRPNFDAGLQEEGEKSDPEEVARVLKEFYDSKHPASLEGAT